MTTIKTHQIINIIVVFILTTLFTNSCSSDSNSNTNLETIDLISPEDQEALLFMLEEEKLARDTYSFLSDTWQLKQFENIKNSEQSHMNAIINLLNTYNIEYTVLPYGAFFNTDLQNFYNQFIEDGQISQSNALQIGATIEDLDIVDLQEFIDKSSHDMLIAVFESLKCGSKNHLRSFVSLIEAAGDTYNHQFLTLEEYNNIISSENEKCNI